MGVINLGWLIKKLKNKGFLTKTDYPSGSTTAGVIKVATSYGTSVTSAGYLATLTRTAAQYSGDAASLYIGKGTLENIKGELVKSVLASLADSDGTAATGTKWDTLVLEKTGTGAYTLSFKNTTTP